MYRFFKDSLHTVQEFLKAKQINHKGTPGQVFIRRFLYTCIGDECLQFDCGLLDRLITDVEEKKKGSIDIVMQSAEYESVLSLYEKTKQLIHTLLSENQGSEFEVLKVCSVSELKMLKSLLFDCRTISLQQSNAEILLERHCTKELGFTREQLLDRDTPVTVLLDAIKRFNPPLELWREYESNEEHLRSNLLLLFKQHMKQTRLAKAATNQLNRLPEVLVRETDGTLERVQQRLQHLSFDDIIAIAVELKLAQEASFEEYLLELDSIFEKVQQHLFLWFEKAKLERPSLQQMFFELPSLQAGFKNTEWYIYVDQESFTINKITTKHVEIVEIGIKCDGQFILEPVDVLSHEVLLPEHTCYLKRYVKSRLRTPFRCQENSPTHSYDAASGREDGKSIESILNTRWNDVPFRYLLLAHGDREQFKVDLHNRCLVSQHAGYLSCPSWPVPVESSIGSNRVVFLRFVLQVKPISEEIREVASRMASSENYFDDRGLALAAAIDLFAECAKNPYSQPLAMMNSLSAETFYLIMYNTSSYFRGVILPELKQHLRRKWEQLVSINKYVPHNITSQKPHSPSCKHVLQLTHRVLTIIVL